MQLMSYAGMQLQHINDVNESRAMAPTTTLKTAQELEMVLEELPRKRQTETPCRHG